jgi:hypothetical protein
MTDRTRPLGEIQRAVIKAMRSHGGTWSEDAGWLWDTISNTRRVMESLLRRGVVRANDEVFSGKFNTWTRRTYTLIESRALGEGVGGAKEDDNAAT